MTLSTLRPDSTVSNTGTLTGAATAHAALSDDSDASYVRLTFGWVATVTWGNLALPAGAVVKTVALRVRLANGTEDSSQLEALTRSPGFANVGGVVRGPSESPSTIWVGSAVAGWTDSAIDAATLRLAGVDVGTIFVYEAYVDVVYVAQPVTSVTEPVGTVSDTNLPTVQWDNTLDADGGPQAGREIKVFTDAQYLAAGFDPDTSTPTATSGMEGFPDQSWKVDQILPDDTYRAYVRVAQVVNGVYHGSDWAFSEFTVNVALPAVPTVTPTAQNSAARIKVDVTANAGPATTDALELQRSVDGGVSWEPARSQDNDVGWFDATAATVYDYEAPNGTQTTYRARALHNYAGEWAASAWGEASTTWAADQWWLKHVIRPELNVPVELFSYSEVNRGSRRGVFQALGASLPVVVADTRLGATGTITVQLHTTAELDALWELLETNAVMLLQGPAAHGEPDRYVSFGDAGTARVIDKGRFHIRRTPLPWTLVAKPTGAQTGAQYVATAEGGEELVLA